MSIGPPTSDSPEAFIATGPAAEEHPVADRHRLLNGRIGLALAVLIAVGFLVLGRHSGGSGPALTSETFATQTPDGWSLQVDHPETGALRYRLSSNGSTLSDLGIASGGGSGITIMSQAASKVSAEVQGIPDPSSLITQIVGVPREATAPTLVQQPQSTTLDGAPASEIAYDYGYRGTQIVQEDVVARHSGIVVFIELDAPASEKSSGESALQSVLDHWTWTSSASPQA